jgi:3-phenylpropionate/trans-cinnamate dioxygenase ferredoxin reductase component
MSPSRIVVIGAGQAGASLVAKLRALGHAGPVTMIGAEPELPYERPPLSKGYLLGAREKERLQLRSAAFYAERDIALLTGTTVSAIDTAARIVIADGVSHPYDALVIATGAHARHLPASVGGGLAGVGVLRNLADVDALAPAFVEGARILIVGAGFIGLEAAASACKAGMRVTVIEAEDRILKRAVGPQTAAQLRALQVSHGVEILENTRLAGIDGDAAGRAARVRLANGSEIPVDVVLAGIGVVAATELAAAAGLALDNGIAVDDRGRTSDPQVWSAGDCASFPWRGRRIRLESVQNAIEQAEHVAENILGADKAYDPVPWFWSDQFDMKLQIAGLNTGATRVVKRAGETGMSFWSFDGDALLAVDALNDARSYMIGRRVLQKGATIDPDKVGDPALDLRKLAGI